MKRHYHVNGVPAALLFFLPCLVGWVTILYFLVKGIVA